jgi:hypothetical protein
MQAKPANQEDDTIDQFHDEGVHGYPAFGLDDCFSRSQWKFTHILMKTGWMTIASHIAQFMTTLPIIPTHVMRTIAAATLLNSIAM